MQNGVVVGNGVRNRGTVQNGVVVGNGMRNGGTVQNVAVMQNGMAMENGAVMENGMAMENGAVVENGMAKGAAGKSAIDLHGILLVDKPRRLLGAGVDGQTLRIASHMRLPISHNPTSHDVVQQVRHWSCQRRIGHTGTLDPMASGLLVLCLGIATRLVEYYQGHDKTYEARVALGSATDTYDAMGQVVARASVPHLTEGRLHEALAAFQGEILQRPPIYSAVKQAGESLHRKARRGEAVRVEPRPVTVHAIELLAFRPPNQISLQIRCSAGTYIRSIAHELGHALGTVAHLCFLRRLEVGPFSVANAFTLADIEEAASTEGLSALLLVVGSGLGMPRLTLSEDERVRLGQGQWVYRYGYVPSCIPSTDAVTYRATDMAAAYDQQGRFLGVVRALSADGKGTVWKAEKWLAHQLISHDNLQP